MEQLSKEEIISLVENEFGKLAHIFNADCLSLFDAKSNDLPSLHKPGVYIFIRNGSILKVGRHFKNSIKRALQHINVPDENNYPMTKYKYDNNVNLILFNIKNEYTGSGKEYRHWIAALEIFLEITLRPEVKTGRIG